MAIHKQYGLTGISSNVQFGKGNGRIKVESNVFKVRNTADNDYLTIKAANPVDLQDLTTKAYVDSVAQGLIIKDSVVASTNSTTTNLEVGGAVDTMSSLSYNNSGNGAWTWTGGGTAVFDGVTLSDGDRVLIKDGSGLTNAKGNGIWVYNLGANTFSRATDANNLTTENLATGISSELRSGVFVFVEQGTVWGSTGWVLSTPATGTVTIGTDLVQFSQFSRSTGIYADDGLGQDGNRVYVKTDGTTIYIDSNDEVAVRSSNTQYQTLISTGDDTDNAVWGAISLDQADATQNALRRDRGGLGSDVSAFANQSLYISNFTGDGTTELAVGSAYTVLRVNSLGVLGYGAIDLAQSETSVTGVLDESNGGTGHSTYDQWDLLIGNASNGLDLLTVGSHNEILRIDSLGNVGWGQLDLGANQVADAGNYGVTGTLKTSNGGTGVNAYTKGDILISGTTTTSSQDGGLTKLSVPGSAGTNQYVLTIQNNNEVNWVNATELKGSVQSRQVALGTADVNLGTALPANSRVQRVKVVINTPYTGAGSVSMTVGDTSLADRLMTDDEIDHANTGIYIAELMNHYASSTQVTVYITGASAGSGYAILEYIPN